MKIAILSNQERSFVRPLAEGLQRMLVSIGVESKIFPNGLAGIRAYSQKDFLKKHLSEPYKNLRFYSLVAQLKKFNAVIVVGHMPTAFMKYFIRDDGLRQLLPNTPIILYDLVYLPTRGLWATYLKEGNPEYGIPEGGHFGLERYDYYLCVSVVSENPLPPEPNPCALIGVNLDDGSLYPSQADDFTALLDFERPNHLEERQVQIEALTETNTKYIELTGSYSLERIREIYRRTSIYFLAHRESFGLPICELQACGSYIFTPYSTWCPSHWIKEDLSKPGEGKLSPNFIVYDNDKEKLIQEITRIKANFSASKVREIFQKYYPQLIHGDTAELREFIELIQSGKIHSRCYTSYSSL
jgi:hypothetical protein